MTEQYDIRDLFSEDSTDVKIDAQNAINGMTQREANCLCLYVSGHTQEEIGELMGCDQSTISRLLASLHKSSC